MTNTPKAQAGFKDRESQTEQAYNYIEEKIVTLELAPGSCVSEAMLCADSSFGRTPIRTALKRLEQQGLITNWPRKGAFIRHLKVEDELAILEVRLPVERVLVRKAARLATPAQRETLRNHVAAMLEAAESGDLHRYLYHDQECDRTVCDAARNPFGTDFIRTLCAHSRRFWIAFSQPADRIQNARLHFDLMNAVADGDEERSDRISRALTVFLEGFCKSAVGLD